MKKLSAQTAALRRIAHAWPAFLATLKPGLTERQAARLLYRTLRQADFTRWAFPFIVAAGPSAAKPHHKPTNRIIRSREFVKIDFGVAFHGWNTDITRTVILGHPTLTQRKLHALILRAQSKASRAVRPGIPARAIDAIARDVISRAGFGKAFIHSTGHGVGRAIHEIPYLSPGPKGDRLLRAGNVITIEPGIYIPKKLGLRIEDMYLVTRRGGRCLSDRIPRGLTIPPKLSPRPRTPIRGMRGLQDHTMSFSRTRWCVPAPRRRGSLRYGSLTIQPENSDAILARGIEQIIRERQAKGISDRRRS